MINLIVGLLALAIIVGTPMYVAAPLGRWYWLRKFPDQPVGWFEAGLTGICFVSIAVFVSGFVIALAYQIGEALL